MVEILLKNQKGFKWFNNHNLSFKGYFKIGNIFFGSSPKVVLAPVMKVC